MVDGLVVVGVCLPPVSSLTRSEIYRSSMLIVIRPVLLKSALPASPSITAFVNAPLPHASSSSATCRPVDAVKFVHDAVDVRADAPRLLP